MTIEDQTLYARMTLERDGGFLLDVDLELEPGEITVMLGPNGSGKSTLVAALAGLVPVGSGCVSLGSKILDDPSAAIFASAQDRHVGVVFQRYLLFEHLDVLDNISFAATVRGTPRADARRDAESWLERLDLGGLGERSPSELSGGQAQRVAIARALASEPAFLLLDEPLAALDVETRGSLRRVLRSQLDEFSGPILLITHDPVDAFVLADRVVIIEGGQITQIGSPSEVAQRPATAYAAALAGLNLLTGSNADGTIELEGSAQSLATANTQVEGRVLVTIHPNAISLHESQPGGSPRNNWATRIATIESLGDITRLTLEDPLHLSVDITPGAVASMGLRPGSEVWASVKATEVFVNPA